MRNKRKKILPVIYILLFLAGLTSFFVDQQIMDIISGLRTPFFILFFELVTRISFLVLTLIAIPALILIIKGKKKGAIALIATTLLAWIISQGLKLVFARARPEVLWLDSVSGFSLPSTHATIAFATIPLLFVFFPSARLLTLAIASLIGFSRVYVGVHYPSDVIFGALLGLAIGSWVLSIKGSILKPHPHTFEIRRKIIHVLFGAAIILLIQFDILNAVKLGGLLAVGVILSLLEKDKRIPFLSFMLDSFEREDARKRLPGEGLLFYLAGSCLAVILFPKEIALAAIAILTIGDAVSHIAGISIGRIKHPLNDKKFIEGWIIGLIAAFFAATLFVSAREAFVGALAGMLIEAFDVVVLNRRVNDNLLIPPIAGIAIVLLRLVRP
ncbi:MAG: phosphatase PAP2 family protein [Nanoarchaeota archaeon]